MSISYGDRIRTCLYCERAQRDIRDHFFRLSPHYPRRHNRRRRPALLLLPRASFPPRRRGRQRAQHTGMSVSPSCFLHDKWIIPRPRRETKLESCDKARSFIRPGGRVSRSRRRRLRVASALRSALCAWPFRMKRLGVCRGPRRLAPCLGRSSRLSVYNTRGRISR